MCMQWRATSRTWQTKHSSNSASQAGFFRQTQVFISPGLRQDTTFMPKIRTQKPWLYYRFQGGLLFRLEFFFTLGKSLGIKNFSLDNKNYQFSNCISFVGCAFFPIEAPRFLVETFFPKLKIPISQTEGTQKYFQWALRRILVPTGIQLVSTRQGTRFQYQQAPTGSIPTNNNKNNE